MEYVKQLKTASMYGGIILFISVLNTLGIDPWGVAAAVLSFLLLAIFDLGKKYIAQTNQTETVKHGFAMVMYPFISIVCVASLFYVLIGGMVWYFWLAPFFFAFILFAVEATVFIEAVKKSKN